MNKDFNPSISVEQFAAYLDGNLSPDESQIVSVAISQDAMLQDIVEVNNAIEDSLKNASLSDFEIPDGILCMPLDLPQIEQNFNHDVGLSNTQLYLKDEYCTPIGESESSHPMLYEEVGKFDSTSDSLSSMDDSINAVTLNDFMTEGSLGDDDINSFINNDNIIN